MFKIGSKVVAESDDSSYVVEGVIVRGLCIIGGIFVDVPGYEIDPGDKVTILTDEGRTTINGWNWSIEAYGEI